MHYEFEVEGRLRRVVVHRVGDGFAVEVDGRPWRIDAVRIDAHTLSLLVGTVPPNGDTGATTDLQPPRPDGGSTGRSLSGGRSHDVAVSPGPAGQLMVWVGETPFSVTVNGRRRRQADGGHAGDGPQRIAAPMPGKIVRILVATGDAVRARQPVIVVEAMKMENELRAGRDGTVAEIHVRAGASVEAGAKLIDIL